ncbi:MAG: cytochrome c [Planctomycetes bacterium]|nr:cytochrome c [Planctomycetota bacterium]
MRSRPVNLRAFAWVLAALAAGPLLVGCRQDMHDQPRLKPYGKSGFFADGRAMRPLVPNTVARGRLFEDAHFHQGRVDGKDAEAFPLAITKDVLARGRERYGIYCINCHGTLGDGDGMIVSRGMKRPPSYHIDRLRAAPPGYFFGVITNGFGVMYDLADRIKAEDRWAIVAYVRALQQSQNATLDDVPPAERDRLLRGE